MRFVCLVALATTPLSNSDRSLLALMWLTPMAAQTGSHREAAESQAAQFTRATLLKSPVSGSFTTARLGDILKEFAHQVEVKTDHPVMWTYGSGFPYGKKLTITIEEQPLEAALDQVLAQAGGTLGYVIISLGDDRKDGWIRLTRTAERGHEAAPATAADEEAAGERLLIAKRHLAANRPAAAKPLLEVIVRKYTSTKACTEAVKLLEQFEK